MKYFREDLNRRLLSTDFKKHVDGIEVLHRVSFFLFHIAQCIFRDVILISGASFRHFHPLQRI